VVKPAGRKQIANIMVQEHQFSERTACQLVGISRTAYRYKAKRRDDERLRVRLKELAVKLSAYGYLLLHGMLKAEGLVCSGQVKLATALETGLHFASALLGGKPPLC
jgi:putative transposase